MIFDSQNEAICYLICLRMKNPPKSIINRIDDKMTVLNPLLDSKENTFTI